LLSVVLYTACSMCALIVLLELFAYRKTKLRILNCLRRNMSRRTKKRLLGNVEFLFEEINALPPELFRKLKLYAKTSPEEAFIVKTFNNFLSTSAVFFAALALFSTWMNFPSSLLDQLSDFVELIVIMLAIIGAMFFAINIHIIINDYERRFRQKFIVAISEVEKSQPVTVHLSEAQYQVLLTSSNHRRY
jgi:hypothetical protein